jgi:hypothetical protein
MVAMAALSQQMLIARSLPVLVPGPDEEAAPDSVQEPLAAVVRDGDADVPAVEAARDSVGDPAPDEVFRATQTSSHLIARTLPVGSFVRP